MDIEVTDEGWGEARPSDIHAVLQSVDAHLAAHFTSSLQETLIIIPSPADSDYPMTHYRLRRDRPIVIQLAATDGRWAQFAYQFAHELCHVLQGFERLIGNPSQWFHETVCELASLFTLRRMAETWPTNPPYLNWASYSASLESYAEERIQRPEHRLPSDLTVSNWLTKEEQVLRQDPYQRDKNGIVAGLLLPIFESDPSGWSSVRSFPTSTTALGDYLLQWRREVDATERDFVERIIECLGYE